MPPPLIVLPRDVRAALRRARQHPNVTGLERMELRHPELAALLMETASDCYHQMARYPIPQPVVRRLTRRIEDLGVLLLDAATIAHARQWQAFHRRPIPPLSL